MTDVNGLLIADRLRWRYDSFRTDLQFIPRKFRHIWAAGKLYAQLLQADPYAHVDNDFVLLGTLPVEARRARVFAQGKDEPGYYVSHAAQAMMQLAGIDVGTVAYNAGIIGGADVVLLHQYCRYALGLIDKLHEQPNGTVVSIVAEQCGLGWFMRQRREPIVELIPIPNSATPQDFGHSRFIHLWAWTKAEDTWIERVEAMLSREFPREYADFCRGFPELDRCLSHARRRAEQGYYL